LEGETPKKTFKKYIDPNDFNVMV